MKKTGMKRAAALLLLLALLSGYGAVSAETLTLSFVGDCTLGSPYQYRTYGSSYVSRIGEAGLDYPFSKSVDLFSADDLTVANCEVVFTDRKPKNSDNTMALSGPKEFAEIFRLGGVEAVNISNNHALDYGSSGREDTIAALESFDIGYFGEDWLYETEVKGVKIGIVGHTYGITKKTMKQYQEQIDQLRADGCDFIIASVHWGREDNYNLNAQQKDYGTQLIDMGADLVFGHGSHTLQPIQYYNGHLIMYSTGNFTFGANLQPKDMDTAVLQVTLEVAEDGTVTTAALRAIPYRVNGAKDFCPYPYTEEEDLLRVWKKLVFKKSTKMDSGLPESFLTTGYADFRAAEEE